MKRIKRFKTLTAVLIVLFYFCSLAPSLWAAPRPVAPGSTGTPPTAVPPPSVPAGSVACPVVTNINPASIRQGQSATLILSGQNLNQIVSITLGTGITVASLNNSNPNSVQVTVQVTVNAPLGNHAVLMTTAQTTAATGAVTGCGTVEARPKLQILARATEQTPDVVAPPNQPTKPPVVVGVQPGRIPGLTTASSSEADKKLSVTEIYPNQWSRGKNYTAKVVGLGFTADMLVQLGDGVQVKGKVKLLNPNLAQIQVEVSGSAGIGERKVQLRLNSQDAWTLTQATAYVKAPAGQGLTQIKLSEMDFKNFLKGKIKLLQPYTEGTNAEKYINDMTQFWWEEENPGTADWYELRFLDSNGQILLKRRIDPAGPGQKPPLFYKPDQVFFDEMCNHKPYGLCGYYLNQTSGTAAMLLNFSWEVAGFKTYTYTKITKKPGSTPGNEQVVKTTETKDVEIEISERWKISGPIQPSGLACTNNEQKKGLDADSQLQIVNLDIAKGRPAGTANTVNFANDQFKLFGQFRFWNPPYNYQAGSVGNNQYTQFNTIFVDWGDGTTLPLKGTPFTDSWGDQRFRIPEGLYQHRYAKTGMMVFRIFMLPFSDIQNADPALVTANYDSQHNNNGNDPYFAVLKAGLRGAWPYGQSGGQSGPSLDDLAKRAHVLYCKEIVIDPRQDPVTNGPLHLVSVTITGANGRGFNEAVEANGPPATIKAQVGATAKKIPGLGASRSSGPKIQSNVKIKTGPAQAGGTVQKTPVNAQVDPSMFYDASDLSLSQCDMLQFNASLTYYGKGEAWITWRMNTNLNQGGLNDWGGILVASQYPVLIGPSRSRDMSKLSPDQADQATADSYDTYPLDAPIQKMESYPVGKAFSLRPEVTVGPETVKTLTAQIIANICEAMAGSQAQSSTDSSLASLQRGQESEAIVSDIVGPQYWEPGQAYAANLKPEPILLAKAAAKTSAPRNTASRTGAAAMAQAVKKSGAKLGVLSPFSEGGRMPTVADISGALSSSAAPEYDTTFPKKPPFYAGAKALSFKAVPNAPDKPCKFLFTTKSNEVFEIFNLQDVKGDSQGRYWGHGTIELQLFTGLFFQRYKKLLPIKISGWQLAGDQRNAAAGTLIKETLNDTVFGSGMEIGMEKIEARAYQTDMNLTLSITAQDQRLRVPGTSDPISWKNRTARLTALGDWFYQDNSDKKISIGWSGFRLENVKAALDLSSQENHKLGGQVQADGFTASSGTEWTGIHLGQALLIPNTATLSGSNPYKKTVDNWGIIPSGLCGNVDIGPFNTTRKGGTIGWDSLHANASGGNFSAVYNNMKVQLPWPYVELKGNAVLADGAPGQDSFIDFRNVQAAKVTRNYSTIIMESSDFVFGMFSDFPGVDWAVKANMRFSFKQEGIVYSTDTVVQDVVFGMDAIAYHKGNVQIPLNGKATFGAVPLDLISMDVSGFGTKALKFDLKTKFSVSEVLEAVEVPLTYGLAKPGNAFTDDYQVVNPVLQPFNIQVAYPAFQPKVTSQMTLKFKKGIQSYAALEPASPAVLKPEEVLYASLSPDLSGRSSDAGPREEPLLLAANGATEDTFNAEKINMKLLGEDMPDVEFRMGHKEGHDYWLMRVKVDTGIMPLAPPFLYAYQIRGGLGHNFPIETFSAPGSIYAIEPVINGSYLFNAGLLAGSVDKVLYAFDGDFTISTGEGALFKFKAWLMKYNHSGDGDFGGYLAYANGSFDGSISGEFGYIGDQVKIVVPEGAATLHFGGDGWYIYLGKDTGPRLEGHTFFIDANAYLMLDSTPRLRVGGGATKHFPAGDCDVVCAYVDVYFDAGFDMSLDPMYIAGEIDLGASAGLCVWKFGCKGININFHAWASVPPPYLYIEFSTSAVPCPVDSIGIGVKVLPSPGIGWSIDWCDCLIFDC